QLERGARVMRQHEDRMVKRRIAAPPPIPRLLPVPRARLAAEHVAAHDGGANVRRELLQHGGALVHFAALEAMRDPPGGKGYDPVVQPLPSHAERLLHALVRTGRKAIERDGDPESEPGHLSAVPRARLRTLREGPRCRASSSSAWPPWPVPRRAPSRPRRSSQFLQARSARRARSGP